MGNNDQALIDYNKAIELDPHIFQTFHSRGNQFISLVAILYHDIGNYD